MSDGQISLKGIIAGYEAERVLPSSPALRALTERHIAPHADAIVRDMLELRAEADAYFLVRLDGIAAQRPSADEGVERKGYPVSYCLEITRYMLTLMSRTPAPAHMSGLRAMHDFVRAGGPVKRVWGALRGGYFQNAIQVGSYYLDVANDTVNPQKPKIEFLPMEKANFNNIGSFFEFARVGQAYWKCRTIPNRYFPELAPFYPAITFENNGGVRLDSRNSFMFPMNIAKRFEPARDFVFSDDRDDDDLAPYVDWIARYAARDARTRDSDHPLRFCPNADSELRAAFVEVAAQDEHALTQSVERALGPDTHFLEVGGLGIEELPHMKRTEA
ncbi:MAG: hypothetical protein K8R18_09405 [Parvibaculum sp.]|uniref:hypothetical protein n=1 Tax=Parvibaculum sp. TaxID=2024848 RepID=UPI0025CD19F7|nr:hypothetical protein [Parvibaculum sp.]MCE9649824.1 hypothetical protein [Parvibaculum sp.]